MLSKCPLQGKGVREVEVQEKNKTGTLQEQITFNEARRGSSQISGLLHPSVLVWRIPRMGQPGGLPSMGSHRVGHD